MTYDFKPKPIALPKDKPNNQTALQTKFAVDELSGAVKKASPNRAVRVGELLETGLFTMSEGGVLVPKDAATVEIERPGANLLINGDMRYHQRVATMASGSGYAYAADRWRRDNGFGAMSLNRLSFPGGQTDVPGGPTYYLNANVTASSSNDSYQRFVQLVENPRQFNNADIIYSFWAKGIPGSKVAIEFEFAGSAAGAFKGGTFTLDNVWKRYVARAKCPKVMEASLANSAALFVSTWVSAGSTWAARVPGLGHQLGSFDFANMQLITGKTDYPFQIRDNATEMMLCQRYYRKSYWLGDQPGVQAPGVRGRLAFGSAAAQGNFTFGSVQFGQRMRDIPGITIWPPDGAQTGGAVGQDDGSIIPATLRTASDMGFEIYAQNTAGRWGIWFQYVADAEF